MSNGNFCFFILHYCEAKLQSYKSLDASKPLPTDQIGSHWIVQQCYSCGNDGYNIDP